METLFYFFVLTPKSNKKSQADLKCTVFIIVQSFSKSAPEHPVARGA